MKLKFTFLFLVSFLVSTIKLSAQRGEIPNGDFQIWDSVPGAGYEDPRNWVSLNSFSSISGELVCEKGQISGTNDVYMKLTSKSIFGTAVLPGLAFCGTMDTVGNTFGFPYAKRPDALIGKWQYVPQGGDTALVGAYFTKWNTTTNTRDSIGIAFDLILNGVPNWETFSIPVQYMNTGNPDTCFVIAMASAGYSPVQDSYLLLNDVDFDLGSGVHEYAQQHFKIFPNPASEKIQLDLTGIKDVQTIELIDLRGKKVRVKSIDLGTTSVDVSDLSRGMYMIRVKTRDAVITEKFTKL